MPILLKETLAKDICKRRAVTLGSGTKAGLSWCNWGAERLQCGLADEAMSLSDKTIRRTHPSENWRMPYLWRYTT